MTDSQQATLSTVFTADSSAQTVGASVREAWKFRPFIAYLTKRDLRTTYLRSYLGWVWSLLNPIAEMAIYSLVFGVILAVNRSMPPAPNDFSSFPHFLLAGMVVWNFYRSCSSKVLNTFAQTVTLRRKLYFPPVAPAISQALTTLVTNSMEILLLFGFFAVVGHLRITAIVLIPAALISTMFGLGVGLALSVANSRFRDVGYLYGIVLRLFFYLLPIIWPLEFVDDRFGESMPWLKQLIVWNPIAKIISISRDGMYFHRWPPVMDVAYAGVFGVVVLVAGWAIFARSSADVAEGL